MGRRLKSASDLPAWFDLNKYADQVSLDAAGWYEQLSVRQSLLSMTRHIDDKYSRFSELVKFIRETPIIDTYSDFKLRTYLGNGKLHELKIKQPNFTLGIRLMTAHEFYKIDKLVGIEKSECARKLLARAYDDSDWDQPHKFDYVDWLDSPVDSIIGSGSQEMNICINTELPDKILIKQFEQFLRLLRDLKVSMGMPEIPWRKPDFEGWVRFAVLPYIDLTIWSYEIDIKIPNRVMADAIFPPGEGGEEVVRKTTEKLVTELLDIYHLDTLASFAAYEITERVYA